ncbi:MAG: FkbM family methyltransferase [Mariprofundus sp.]|nr:FkbM family methyltransferase [Mariprofundus sp.]
MRFSDTVKKVLAHFGISVTKNSTFNQLTSTSREYDRLSSAIGFLNNVVDNKLREALGAAVVQKAQIQQDIFVLLALDFKRNGFFVEFGSTNGIDMSNSWVMEKKFAWDGIVAEPGKGWQKELNRNRACHISNKCVWKKSNENILFNETSVGGFSTIDTFSTRDRHSESRASGEKYYVETLSLNDLLTSFNAPRQIDYLSIDTEGSEFDILLSFDFNKWDISIITVEHNFTDSRKKLQKLLESNGFIRVFTSISNYDDWYVKPHLIDRVKNSFLLEM